MAIGIYRFDKDIQLPDSKSTFFHPVATMDFYNRVWVPAIKEKNIKLFIDSSRFGFDQLDEAINELKILKEWALNKLEEKDKEKMVERIEKLLDALHDESTKGNDMFYIF